MINMAIIIYTDGACSGNPGPMGIGIIIYEKYENRKILAQISEYIGDGTNNIAEYTAVVKALEAVKIFNPKKIEVRSDSELLIKQLNGEYKVRNSKLRDLKRNIELLSAGIVITFTHVPREENSEADKLSKMAIPNSKTNIQKKLC